jgi:hypothetical protein
METILKDLVMVWNLPGGTEENYKKSQADFQCYDM